MTNNTIRTNTGTYGVSDTAAIGPLMQGQAGVVMTFTLTDLGGAAVDLTGLTITGTITVDGRPVRCRPDTTVAVALFESGRRRRQALGVLLLTGLAVSGTLGAILFQDEFSVRAVAHGLYYGVGERVENPVVGLYVMATTAPLLMSRHRFVLLFGICVLVGSVVTELFFFGAQASVWCFFAAVASVLVFLHVRRERLLASIGPQRPAEEFEA